MLRELILSILLTSAGTALAAQQAPVVPPAAPTDVIEEAPPPIPAGEAPDDPWEAYGSGFYDRALQGFVDLEVERPEDPEVQLNLGSSYYQMRDYTAADQAFATAAMATDPPIRAQALYGLGNSAFRQGRLGEAVELFQSVLEITPDDEDAKFNLEFVRDEIRRRHEEQQKRQEEEQQNQEGEQEEQEGQDGEQQQEQNQQQGDQGEGEQAPDADQDGLPDSTEQNGENPTDPQNPDTDGDGLADGEEDQNRNGKVDGEETDPNRVDSDGDGIPDGAEQQASQQEAGEGEPEDQEGLTPEEAERYLQALGEDRPPARPHPGGKKTRRGKDW